MRAIIVTFVVLAALAGCASAPTPEPAPRIALGCPPVACPVCESCPASCPAPAACPAVPACPVCPPAKPEPAPPAPTFTPTDFSALPNWAADDHRAALAAFRVGCPALRDPRWRPACERAAALTTPTRDAARAFFEAEFTPNVVTNEDGTTSGLVTGYYEPLLRGSRTRTGAARYPIYAPPDDLLTIDLVAVSPETRNLRLRGRVDGRRIVPYYSRGEIESGRAPLAGREIAWVEDPIELFFLQVQGSGRVQLADGSSLRVGYADQNGHPYRSIGRYLVDRGELKLHEASMQGIQAWARANPQRLDELLSANPSYVFFREVAAAEIPDGLGPHGALGVPLTPERSVAVDPRFVPLGAPLYLATTRPNSSVPLERLVVAQDTGGAIRGAVRIDYFWGFGAPAGQEAGRMRQQGRVWALLPRGFGPR
jgi:membrane-bound lytic murein transglycosylase A